MLHLVPKERIPVVAAQVARPMERLARVVLVVTNLRKLRDSTQGSREVVEESGLEWYPFPVGWVCW